MKKQNIFRHLDLARDLVENLMMRIVDGGMFRKDQHGLLFKEVTRFLFIYSCGNLSS